MGNLYLASVIKERLAEHDPNAADRWQRAFMNRRPDDQMMAVEYQMEAVNHFLRIQLGLLTQASTLDERECLTNESQVEDWLRNFQDVVLPTIIEHQLPVVFNNN